MVKTMQASDAWSADLDLSRIQAEPTRDPAHGDIATNAALVLAKQVGQKPRDLAQRIADGLAGDDIAQTDVAGPGFVNIRLADDFWRASLSELLRRGPSALLADIGRGRTANVEYVSANPTGPLHVGHARGAIYGDVLASLFEAVGYDVTREYYVNDAGAQVDTLAWSAYLRYLQALGDEVAEQDFEGFYPGEYLIQVGQDLAKVHGTALKEAVGDAERGGPLTRTVDRRAQVHHRCDDDVG